MLKATLEFNLENPKEKKIFRLASKAENFVMAIDEYFSWTEEQDNILPEQARKELLECLKAFDIEL